MAILLESHYQTSPSWLHRLDPSSKILWVLFLILSVNLAADGEWILLFLLLLLVWGAAFSAGVGIVSLLTKSLIALPFVAASLVVPFTTPGTEFLSLPWLGWTATEQGIVRFLSLLFRFFIAVQAAFLLTSVTRFGDLLEGLRRLGIPLVLVSVIGFMYRYLTLISDEAVRMLRARAARSVSAGRGRPPVIWQARVVGLMVGSLFLRAFSRSERIYTAMLSRGYDGKPKTLFAAQMKRLDWLVIAGSISLTLLLLLRRLP